MIRATISAPRVTCSRMIIASARSSRSGLVRIASGIPILPMSWKSAAVARAPSCFAGKRSSRPIASETRRTRCECPAVYGSRASTAALSVSIVSSSVASSSREDSTRSCERCARSSFWARSRAEAPRTSSARTIQRTPKTTPTAYQTVFLESAMIPVTEESSSATSAAPRTRPPGRVERCPDLHDGRSLAYRVDDLGARPVGLDRRPQIGARATAPHSIGATAGEHETAVAPIDVEPMHVRWKSHAPSRDRRVRGSARARRRRMQTRLGRCRRERPPVGRPRASRRGRLRRRRGSPRTRGGMFAGASGSARGRTSGIPACAACDLYRPAQGRV